MIEDWNPSFSERGKDEGYVLEGGREGDKVRAGTSVEAWLMSAREMCLLSTEWRLQGSE